MQVGGLTRPPPGHVIDFSGGGGRTVEEQFVHNVVWDMSRDEWNRGGISLKELLTKGLVEEVECECDKCEATTTSRYKYTTTTRSPNKLIINLNRSVNMVDRDTANDRYYLHDADNGRDILTFPITCPRVLEYTIKTLNILELFDERIVRYNLQGVICMQIQEVSPSVKCHYVCHCINQDDKWVHYDDYVSKDSTLFDDNQDEFVSESVVALFYKRMTNVV